MRSLAIFGACLALTACGDPLRNVDRLSDVEADATAAAIAAAEASGDAGLLEQLSAGELVAAEAAAAAAESATQDRPRRGLLALFGRRDTGDDVTLASSEAPANDGTVALGTALPFGEIARVCGARRGELGQEVIRAEGFRIYDTAPSATGPRIFYVTGFKDRCARTFTAALVLESDAATHEFVRYESGVDAPYSAADNAYEEIKAQVCRVRRGDPCGARINQLSNGMQFLTVYDRFGGSPDAWVEILLHDGEVAAIGPQRL